ARPGLGRLSVPVIRWQHNLFQPDCGCSTRKGTLNTRGEEHLLLESADNPAALPDGSLLVSRINQERRWQLFHFWPETGKLQGLPVEMINAVSFFPIEASHDGRFAIVFGSLLGKSGESPSLMTVDLVTGSARLAPVNGLDSANLRTYSLSPDGKTVIAAFR